MKKELTKKELNKIKALRKENRKAEARELKELRKSVSEDEQFAIDLAIKMLEE